VLPLWVAEMDVRLGGPSVTRCRSSSSGATRDMSRGTGSPRRTPPSPPGAGSTRSTRGGWSSFPSGAGRVRGTCSSRPSRGEQAVINPPLYAPSLETDAHGRRRLVEFRWCARRRVYELDLAAQWQAFAGGARTYLLCGPHHHVGRVWTRPRCRPLPHLPRWTASLSLWTRTTRHVDEPHRHVPFATLDPPAARAHQRREWAAQTVPRQTGAGGPAGHVPGILDA